MHVIPQSWSHLHILVSVFPPFGLLFSLGFYVAGQRAKNEGIKRTCLVLIGLIALLSIPIYLSGDGAMAQLSGNARYAKNAMATHYGWGIIGLLVLAITGLSAFFDLWRTRGVGRAFSKKGYLTLGLAALALGLTAAAGGLGFAINHRELESTVVIPDVSTSPLWPHVHIILNHLPTAGFVFALFFFVVALVTNNNLMKQGSLILFVICAIAGIPTYVTGTASMWALTQPPLPDISKAAINAHRDMALWTLVGLAFTATASWIELWRYRACGRFSMLPLTLVLLFALATLAIMTETGHRGGLINHPEIRTAGDVLPSDPNAGISMGIEAGMKNLGWFMFWQIVHFFGYCVIFGTLAAVMLRVLGFWKSVPYAAVHRLLPLAFIGVLMNVVSGMLMMLADSYRYVVSDVMFAPKIAFIFIAAAAVLYFSVSDRLWSVKAGEDAPKGAKWIAVMTLLGWAGVIACGRLLPYV
ncbi:MAG TPA: DUF2231 domain-containing protein [Xanthobacteraceae bacterium]|nr:DUF2231 domain-containing protein [Xanthobacteraceae bacterium]